MHKHYDEWGSFVAAPKLISKIGLQSNRSSQCFRTNSYDFFRPTVSPDISRATNLVTLSLLLLSQLVCPTHFYRSFLNSGTNRKSTTICCHNMVTHIGDVHCGCFHPLPGAIRAGEITLALCFNTGSVTPTGQSGAKPTKTFSCWWWNSQ